ncbi:receptor-type tyrosine-protein phosphatase U-like isoform X2 [Ostrea edulis]|uniref:receptor-type tyrosine-protein phosphatase U-like isoform X2 n=1 Tax=Ostrea edulis TaxID=37623 RepID=UPI0024AF429F|nr:receptor-type tyrosine-protein phosphatase U-like isoform X2 [Ostrea edulis]
MDCYIVYYLIGLFHLINSTHQQFVNVAYGKSARISTRYNDNDFTPGKAVDGDTSTYPLDCALSASGQKEAWLQVDLGEKKNIASISFIHGGLGWNAKALSPQYSGIKADSDGTGTVYQRDGNALCLENFNTNNARVICLIWGFLPDSAIFGNTGSDKISSRYIRCHGNETNINQCPSGMCTRDRAATVTCQKGSTLAGFSVYVSDTQNWTTGSICYQHDIQEISNTNDININCVTSGRYITIYNARNQTSYTGVSDNAYINICEINVQGCGTGFYGANCTKCPENCLNGSCHFQIGFCFDCKDGYTGEMCESECAAGFHGQRCSLMCGDCRDEAACNNMNGSCPDGCSAGRRGDKCDLDCEYGYFGYNCNNTCYLPNCQNSTSCNTISGECLVGCVEGWAGKTCNVCAETYHGQSCNLSCSVHCKDRLCDPVTGFCDACIEKRSGDFCENEISVNNPAAVVSAEVPFTIIGAVVGAFLLVILVLLLICILVRRKRRKDTELEDAIRLEPQVTPMTERKPLYYHEEVKQEIKGEQPNVYYNVSYIINPEEVEEEDIESEIETANGSSIGDLGDIELLSENLGEIPVQELHGYILRKHENNDESFKAEFKALPEGDITRCTVGSQEKNILKNRFKNTLPYDHSRVILEDPNGDDYINANFIPSSFREREYIACQGPKPTTVKDFWRMIWQEQVTTVVMLTGITEGRKRKCEQYWPNRGRTIIYGKFAVTNTQEKVYACYTIRRMEVKNTQGKTAHPRVLNHFHFTGWPDHGVPSTSQLLSFYFKVRDQILTDNTKKPLVVHCSAGVGRTGTFIAIDAQVQYGLKTGTVNITKYVSTMRKERMHMIQTSGQYITVYKCLNEFFNFPRHEVKADTLPNHIKEKQALQEEYTELTNYIQHQREYETDNVPHDKENLDGDSLIVADFPSPWLEEGILVSRHPIPKELTQFMSVLMDISPSVIVTIDSSDEQSTTEQWIPEGQNIVIGRYVVKKAKSRVDSVGRKISTTGIAIQHGNDEELEVRIIQPMISDESVYSNTSQLPDIIDAITSMALDREKPIMIIHREHSPEVMMTVLILNCLYQLMYDGETDVCFLARYLLSLQSSPMLTFKMYEDCYQILNRFSTKTMKPETTQREENIYAN